jgi:hypothetical protein
MDNNIKVKMHFIWQPNNEVEGKMKIHIFTKNKGYTTQNKWVRAENHLQFQIIKALFNFRPTIIT